MKAAPIGIFDSGVGGLSVWRAVRDLLPAEDLIYVADQAHVPYGPRPLDQVREFSRGVVRFLLEEGVKLVVIACNTASAAALQALRHEYPDVPFVGMEPAVKPAAERTTTGVVGVLATPATFQGALYASVVERFARDVRLLQHTCPGLVQQIERGALQASETRAILEDALLPMLAENIDTVVLGCTHYPFVIPLITQIVGPHVRVIDPAPAVARQVQRVLADRDWLQASQSEGRLQFYTSGDAAALQAQVQHLLGLDVPVSGLRWEAGQLLKFPEQENKL